MPITYALFVFVARTASGTASVSTTTIDSTITTQTGSMSEVVSTAANANKVEKTERNVIGLAVGVTLGVLLLLALLIALTVTVIICR